jgi:hypothetical protein
MVYISAVSQTQLPRHAPEHRGSRFIAAFDQKGQLVWFKQSKDFGKNLFAARLAVDKSNNIYLFANPTLLKVSPKGDVQWSVAFGDGRRGLQSPTLMLGPDGSVYLVSGGPAMDNVLVAKVSADGKAAWSKLVDLNAKATTDPVEGTEWVGQPFLYGFLGAGLSNGVLYIVTAYKNSYQLGFDPPKPHSDVLFAAIDLNDGSIAGAHQYRVGQHFSPVAVGALSNGRFVVVGKNSGTGLPDMDAITVRPPAKPKTTAKSPK